MLAPMTKRHHRGDFEPIGAVLRRVAAKLTAAQLNRNPADTSASVAGRLPTKGSDLATREETSTRGRSEGKGAAPIPAIGGGGDVAKAAREAHGMSPAGEAIPAKHAAQEHEEGGRPSEGLDKPAAAITAWGSGKRDSSMGNHVRTSASNCASTRLAAARSIGDVKVLPARTCCSACKTVVWSR